MRFMIDEYYFSRRKRLFDIFMGGFMLIATAPLILACWILLFLWYGGEKIIYSQIRAGKNGKMFCMYKFRTMHLCSEKIRSRYFHLNMAPLPMFKIHNDPRFTSVGRVLSHLGLDELPQIWNVLRGDMSLIGPRPLPINEYRYLPSNWKFRAKIKPGMFSHWTVAPNRHESLQTWVEIDNKSLQRGSLKEDLLILFQVFFFFLQKLSKQILS